MKHFCIINQSSNIVEYVVSLEDETDNFTCGFNGCFKVEIPEHDPSLFGKKYLNGEFVEP